MLILHRDATLIQPKKTNATSITRSAWHPSVMAKLLHVKIEDLVFDEHNANQGTDAGQTLIGQSIEHLGLGRSVLVDKHNRLIAGNKTTTGAIDQGFTNAIVIETTGNELVVVRRTDLDLNDDDDKRARALALADNQTSAVNLEWNTENIALHFDAVMSLDMPDFVFELDEKKKEKKHSDLSGNLETMYKIEIEFDDETAQREAFEKLETQGYKCRILTL